jgi:hypothetical protein
MIETIVFSPTLYLAVKFLTLIMVIFAYWFITAHHAKHHQPES